MTSFTIPGSLVAGWLDEEQTWYITGTKQTLPLCKQDHTQAAETEKSNASERKLAYTKVYGNTSAQNRFNSFSWSTLPWFRLVCLLKSVCVLASCIFVPTAGAPAALLETLHTIKLWLVSLAALCLSEHLSLKCKEAFVVFRRTW